MKEILKTPVDEVFEMLEEIFILTDKIKNSFDEIENKKNLRKILTLRIMIKEILTEEGIDYEQEDDN